MKGSFSTANENGRFREHLTWSTLYFQKQWRKLRRGRNFSSERRGDFQLPMVSTKSKRLRKPSWITNKKLTGVFRRQRKKEKEERKRETTKRRSGVFSWNWCRHSTSEIVYFHTGLLRLSKLHESYFIKELRKESTRKSSLLNFQWTKILYPNNFN